MRHQPRLLSLSLSVCILYEPNTGDDRLSNLPHTTIQFNHNQ